MDATFPLRLQITRDTVHTALGARPPISAVSLIQTYFDC